jgi:hypothetical protein
MIYAKQFTYEDLKKLSNFPEDSVIRVQNFVFQDLINVIAYTDEDAKDMRK